MKKLELAKYYFQLQIERFKRALSTFGLHPLVGFVLIVLLFVGISKLIFYKFGDQGIWLYLLLFSSSLLQLCSKKRIDNIQRFFKEKDTRIIRFLENVVLLIPFLIVTIFEQQYIASLLFLLPVIICTFLRINFSSGLVIPTPFGQIPFENPVGFRKYFWLIILLIGLYIQGILVKNYNIGIGVQGFLFIVVILHYFKLERSYNIWIFSTDVKTFLLKKIKQGIYASSLLCLPLAVLNIVFQPNLYLAIILVQCLGYLFIIFIVLAKYSMYPYPMNLPQSILFILCVIFPPLLLITIPFFYKKAIRALKPILHD